MHPTYPLVFDELRPTKAWFRQGDDVATSQGKWTQGALRKMDYATMTAIAICFVTYMLVGVGGSFYCASVGMAVPGDILTAFPAGWIFSLARVCVAVSVVGSYAANHFVGHACFADLWWVRHTRIWIHIHAE